VTTRDGVTETEHKVPAIVERLWPQFETGQVTDAGLRGWLTRNGIDRDHPAEVQALADRLSWSHVMALAGYIRHGRDLINTVTMTQLSTPFTPEWAVRIMHDRKIHDLIGNYLDNLAGGGTALPLPPTLCPLLHESLDFTSKSKLRPDAQDYVDAKRAATEALADIKRLWAERDPRGVCKATRALARANQKADGARVKISGAIRKVAPRLFEEVLWHADMVHDALMRLPTVGKQEKPVIAYRGDWMPWIHSPTYGGTFVDGMSRNVLSVSLDLDVAVRLLSENSASDNNVIAVYKLTGVNARDISVFSSSPEDREAALPAGSRSRQVEDPKLVQQVRDRLPSCRKRCRIIVLEEVDRRA